MSDDRIEQTWGESGADIPDGPPAGAGSRQRYAESLNEQGVWFTTSGRPHLAVRCFRRACVAWPHLAAAWTNLATTLVMLGRGEEALTAIQDGARAGAIGRSTAAQHRDTIRKSLSPEHLSVRRYPVGHVRKSNQPIRRPRSKARRRPRRSVTVYMLLRTATYNTNFERKIPAA